MLGYGVVRCSDGADWSPIQISARRYRSDRIRHRLHAAASHGRLPERRVRLPTGRTGSESRVSIPHRVRTASVQQMIAAIKTFAKNTGFGKSLSGFYSFAIM